MKTGRTKFLIAALTGAAVLVSCRAEQPMPEVPKAEGAGTVVDVAPRTAPAAIATTNTVSDVATTR